MRNLLPSAAICVALSRVGTVAWAQPNLPVQRIAANDLIAITVYDAPEFSRTARAGSDGYITLPMLKQRILVEGRMPAEVGSAIAEALRSEHLIVDPAVTVTIAEYQSRPVSVIGAVKQPVTFQADGNITLLQALARAGGLAPEAGSEILVTRAQPGDRPCVVRRVPVKGLMDSAEPLLNLTLMGGELIRVPEAGKVFIMGNVRRPGVYPIQGETETTVLQMLAVAEGLLPYATKQAYIYRREASGKEKAEIAVPLRRILERKAADTPLRANDILYIPDAKGRRMTLAAIERILLFGSGASTAAIYAGVR
jgi:polysaccharide export outer membrane protein